MAKHVIILGAGISGLSSAWRLGESGIAVDILESSNSIGGLAGTIREGDYCIDYGPHSLFSEHDDIIETVVNLFEKKLQPQPRRVKFHYKGKYLDYPLTPQGVLLQMGLWSGIRATLSFLKAKLFPRKRVIVEGEDETVEDWAISSFGEQLYRTFFKPYTEQFWKIPCSELSSRSIPTNTRMSFMNTLRMLLHRKVSSTGESLIEREMLPTYYPDTGFAEIPEKIAELVKKSGGKIHLDCKVVGVSELANGKMRVTYDDNGQHKKMDADYVISTIPLPWLIKMLEPKAPDEVLASTERLDYRSLVVLGMVTEKQNILDCGYIYLLDRPYNRITELNEFSPLTSPPGENIIMVEMPCLRNSKAWSSSKEELFDMCVGSLSEDGILGPGDTKELFLIKASCAYPIYTKDYAVNLNRLFDYLKKYKALATLGRCGEFMYMDIDKCMKRAFEFTDDLLKQLK